MELPIVIMLLVFAGGVSGAHFQGGTFKWSPLGDNRVQVTYSYSFNGFKGPTQTEITKNHHICNNTVKGTGEFLGTKGYLACDGHCFYDTNPEYEYCYDCLEEDPGHSDLGNPKMVWQCTDFDVPGNYDIGGRTFVAKIPIDTNKLVIYSTACCWVGLVNVEADPNEKIGWKMFTEIDLNHQQNGVPNSSPVSAPIPVQLFHQGCDYWFEIPVTDPDNDNYRCRVTEGYDDECYKEGSRRGVCGKLKGIHVFPNCTLHLDTHGEDGNYAVRVVIEDLDADGNVKSMVSLSFLLKVSPDDSTCNRPLIIAPGKTCSTIPVNERYEVTIVAEAADESLEIVRIDTDKPLGMTMTGVRSVDDFPLRKSKTLSWVPGSDQVYAHVVGYRAVDSGGFTSEWNTLNLKVVDVPPLSPLAADSYPKTGQEVPSPKKWSVVFNRAVERPTHSAYITLISQDNKPVGQVDTSNENAVTFGSHNNIIFDMPINDFPGQKTYTLQVGEGAVIDSQYGDVDCPFPSIRDEWPVTVGEDTAYGPRTTKTPVVEPPVYECERGEVDIQTPTGSEDGEKCIIHLEKTSFTASSKNSINLPYKVCCETTCRDMTIG